MEKGHRCPFDPGEKGLPRGNRIGPPERFPRVHPMIGSRILHGFDIPVGFQVFQQSFTIFLRSYRFGTDFQRACTFLFLPQHPTIATTRLISFLQRESDSSYSLEITPIPIHRPMQNLAARPRDRGYFQL